MRGDDPMAAANQQTAGRGSSDELRTGRGAAGAHGRVALLPAPGIPLLYFGLAHLSLGLAAAVLVVQPSLPGGFYFHPRMVALVHLVTLGWISGSILGAFYIVAPLALGLPLRPGWPDRVAFGSFAIGLSGMIAHFWMGEYHGMVWSAAMVAAAVLHVGVRAAVGLGHAIAPWPVTLHVVLAFANMLGASVLGILVGVNRLHGSFGWSPLSAAVAHAHLAAIGWAMMMVVGLSYRLVPMILPAALPSGRSMAVSAVCLQGGAVVLTVTLLRGSAWALAGALLVVAGLASFVAHVRRIVAGRRPRPPALPRPDWATWQTHTAFGWLLLTTALGVLLVTGREEPWPPALGWTYGTLGLVGFLSQIVVGIQGRLLPLHGWYRAFEARGMQPPPRSAHTLASPVVAKWIFLTWAAAVPTLTGGLAAGSAWLTAAGSALLLAGVSLNAVQTYLVATTAMPKPGRPAEARTVQR